MDRPTTRQGASDRLTNAIDIDGGRCDERNGEADGGRQQAGNHQHAEPTHIDAVVGVGNPLTKSFPVALASAANGGGHNRKEDG